MSVRMRHTKGQTGSRRSHHALRMVNIVKDAEGKPVRLPHHLDELTGMYRGKQITTPKVKEPKVKHSHATHHEHTHDEKVKNEARPAETIAAGKTTKTKAPSRIKMPSRSRNSTGGE